MYGHWEKTGNYGIKDLSIIIPVGAGDRSYEGLILQLQEHCKEAEIIMSFCEEENTLRVKNKSHLIAVTSPGRGRQLNAGSRLAKRKFLWFLHADSVLDDKTLSSLMASINKQPQNLHYHQLKFLKDGPLLTTLNAVGANMRSFCFKLPFGDQGYCLSRDIFNLLDGFDEELKFGEDHYFIHKLKKAGYFLTCTKGKLLTSARKYQHYGWTSTTLKHLYLTIYQWCQFHIRTCRIYHFRR